MPSGIYRRRLTLALPSMIACLVVATVGPRASAETNAPSFSDRFLDPEDGMFDMTEWLGEAYGFLPVPIIVTEPAVGYGAGLAVAWLNQRCHS